MASFENYTTTCSIPCKETLYMHPRLYWLLSISIRSLPWCCLTDIKSSDNIWFAEIDSLYRRILGSVHNIKFFLYPLFSRRPITDTGGLPVHITGPHFLEELLSLDCGDISFIRSDFHTISTPPIPDTRKNPVSVGSPRILDTAIDPSSISSQKITQNPTWTLLCLHSESTSGKRLKSQKLFNTDSDGISSHIFCICVVYSSCISSICLPHEFTGLTGIYLFFMYWLIIGRFTDFNVLLFSGISYSWPRPEAWPLGVFICPPSLDTDICLLSFWLLEKAPGNMLWPSIIIKMWRCEHPSIFSDEWSHVFNLLTCVWSGGSISSGRHSVHLGFRKFWNSLQRCCKTILEHI